MWIVAWLWRTVTARARVMQALVLQRLLGWEWSGRPVDRPERENSLWRLLAGAPRDAGGHVRRLIETLHAVERGPCFQARQTPAGKKVLKTAHTRSTVCTRTPLDRWVVVGHQGISTAGGTTHDSAIVTTPSAKAGSRSQAPARRHGQHAWQAAHHHGEAVDGTRGSRSTRSHHTPHRLP